MIERLNWLALTAAALLVGCLEAQEGAVSGPVGQEDALAGQDVVAPLPTPCRFAPPEEPIELLSFPGEAADASDLLVLTPGSASQPATLAVKARNADANYWHPEVHLARVRVEAPWPSGVVIEKPLAVFGYDPHEWGTLADAVGPNGRVALLWDYAGAAVEPSCLRLQTFDTATWKADPPIDVTPQAAASLSLSVGASIAGTSYAGDGYGIAYRRRTDDGVEPAVAVLDEGGGFVLGPLSVAPASEHPWREADLVWSGETYLVTVSFDGCPLPEPFCQPRTISVQAIRPPTEPAGAGAMEVVSTFDTLDAAAVPGRPHAAAHSGSVWTTWYEVSGDAPGSSTLVRLARLNADGSAAGEPVVVATDIQPTTGPSISTTVHGVVVIWPEHGDDALDQSTPGHDRLEVRHLDFDGQPVQDPFQLPITGMAYYRGIASVAIQHPRSLIVTWSAASLSPGEPSSVFLGQIPCEVF